MNSENSDDRLDDALPDERLQSLLRDIEIPHDLKQQLLQIATTDDAAGGEQRIAEVVHPSMSKDRVPSANRRWIGIVVAASVLIVAVLGFRPLQERFFSGGGGGRVVRFDIKRSEAIESLPRDLLGDAPGSTTGRESISSSNEVLEQLAWQDQQLSEQILVMEYQSQIDALKRQLRSTLANSSLTQNDLASRREAVSVVLAMTGKATITFEGSVDDAVKEMKFVIENYPDSRGAEIATEFINQVASPDQY